MEISSWLIRIRLKLSFLRKNICVSMNELSRLRLIRTMNNLVNWLDVLEDDPALGEDKDIIVVLKDALLNVLRLLVIGYVRPSQTQGGISTAHHRGSTRNFNVNWSDPESIIPEDMCEYHR